MVPELFLAIYKAMRKGDLGKAWDRAALEAEDIFLRELKKRGGDAITLPPEEVSKWKASARGVWDKEINRWEDKGKPAKEVFKEIEAFVKQYR